MGIMCENDNALLLHFKEKYSFVMYNRIIALLNKSIEIRKAHCTFFSKNTEFQPRNLLTYLVGIKPDCDRYLRISKQLL